MSLVIWCNRAIRWAFYALFAVVPAIWLPWNYELFEFNKMMVTYGVTAIVFCAWVTKWIAEKKIRIAKTPLDIPIVLFLISQLISSLLSIDPHVSWFGYYSRFNGGMWSLICYTVLYYAFVSNFKDEIVKQEDNKIRRLEVDKIGRINDNTFLSSYRPIVLLLLYTTLLTAFAISLYGVAESFGIDKHLWVQDVQHRVFSTLGQPNWLAAYLVALIPIAMVLALRSLLHIPITDKSWKHAVTPGFMVWTLVSSIFFWTLILTRSRSGFMGFVAADCVLLTLLAWSFFRTKTSSGISNINIYIPWAGALHAIFAIIVFFNGTKIDTLDSWITFRGLGQKLTKLEKSIDLPKEAVPPVDQPPSGATLLETGISQSTDIRKHVWTGAIAAWRSTTKTILLGTGTETFAFAFYQFRPKEHNMTSEWDFLYNKAHNEYLNYLATTGAIGLGSYLVILGTFCFWFIKSQISNLKFQINDKGKSSNETSKIGTLDLNRHLKSEIEVLQIALFAGWTSILVTNFWGFSVVIMQLFLFLFPAMIVSLQQRLSYLDITLPVKPVPSAAAPVVMVITCILLLGNLLAGWWADTRFATGYRYNRAEDFIQADSFLSRAVILRPGEPFYHDELATALAGKAVLALAEKNATLASDLAQKAIAQSDKALTQSPKNVNFWKTRTKIYYSLSTFEPQLILQSVSALEQAFKLSPNDPKIMYNLAIIYGRAGENDKAITILKKGIEVKPNYRDLYYGLYIFYTETNQKEEAKKIVEQYLTLVDPKDTEFNKFLSEL